MSLSALDLLTIPGHEPEILRCLSQRPRLTLMEIARVTKIALEELEPVVKQMVRDRKLEEDGGRPPATYSVRFALSPNARPRTDSNDLLTMLK